LVGGLLGCKNDSYRPLEGLDREAAFLFHKPQAKVLAASGVNYLMAATLPCLSEALGMAQALADTGLEYIVSFVIASRGRILDGTSMDEAFATIDGELGMQRPLGYMVNCAHPSFLKPEEMSPKTLARLKGYQANASSLDHEKLDNAQKLEADDLWDWVTGMLGLNMENGIPILGGCCGTTSEYLKALVLRYENSKHV
jgi:S-methylmethionine-dependent homocysteine/selenocysteine methylase